jgi:hypothetical protein
MRKLMVESARANAFKKIDSITSFKNFPGLTKFFDLFVASLLALW